MRISTCGISNRQLQQKISSLRKNLSLHLNRPTLQEEEMYYSVSLTGSSLKRHLDERHEELKGRRGWLTPTRRSLSWLIYLSDDNWDSDRQGGQLRTFPQSRSVATSASINGFEIIPSSVGANAGDLQVAWLIVPSNKDENDESESILPVYLDCCCPRIGDVALYLADATGGVDKRLYVSRDFPLHNPRDGERDEDWERHLFPFARYRKEPSQSLLKIEEPALWAQDCDPAGSKRVDIAPTPGTLVIFDSVWKSVLLKTFDSFF